MSADPGEENRLHRHLDVRDQPATEERLHQSQQMEAFGRLTGGLAHDFNNLLMGITGSLDLLRTRVAQRRFDSLDRYIEAAQDAADRAASVTHRLLAFSRRQTLDPRPHEVNALIDGLDELIRHTVGPERQVVVSTDPRAGTTLIDGNQLENALLNLAINARDAMPQGGILTIATAQRDLSADEAEVLELPPGRYVELSVSDTGVGMSPDTLRRAFDPFFTTKPLGSGTGLGLSMIYGFARQSGGHASIRSTLGRGTTVSLFLPRHRVQQCREAARQPPSRTAAGQLILVVDDEPAIRQFVAESLEDLGYRTITAESGDAGLSVLQGRTGVTLLVTDIGMPGTLNGRQLADAARAIRPGLRVLFITGYAPAAAIGNLDMHDGMQVLPKPFGLNDLADRVQQLMQQ